MQKVILSNWQIIFLNNICKDANFVITFAHIPLVILPFVRRPMYIGLYASQIYPNACIVMIADPFIATIISSYNILKWFLFFLFDLKGEVDPRLQVME